MKARILTFMALLLMLCGAFTACDNTDNGFVICYADYPRENLPFTEYSLNGTSSNWVNLVHVGSSKSKLLIINSDAEMRNYVTSDYPPVDFSKQTLLLAYGLEPYQNTPDDTKFEQTPNRVLMTVNLRPSLATAFLEWQVAILVDKLNDKSNVTLNLTRKTK